MSKLPEPTATGDQPQDAKVIPFLPVLRSKLGQRLSPPATELAVTEAGAKSRLWRGLGAIWHGLVTLSLAGTIAVTLAPHPVFAAQTPSPGSKDARVRNVDYDPDQVVSIVGQFRHAIEIQFGPGETVTQAALGDTISWQIAPVGNIVFLKPREKAGGTNLIVVTNANGSPRTYHFNLVLGGGAAMYGIRFHYPKEERAAAALQTQMAAAQAARSVENGIVTAALDHAVIEGTRNMNYTVQGDAALQPTEISDNGEFTVLRYPGHADIPSIFAVDVDGTETIVPYDVREDFVVIHAVYRQLRLRRGNSVLCVYNEGAPRNDRSDRTGTVSNVVERKVKGQ
ncbi:type IV secretion system protein VirB9 [Novosphingobium sp. 1748]|uniref:P-type conjugative transfer protein VirB9 n=1 Tax=Novosphingobium sp. 1748 TaxID=2817760 RepID=UPI00285F7673|nr:P-type conjugative transfer protein VirB9 [Novosphingobium sp. 1748]MDR6710247.1 type IV secretion system protein VirB9 [Novosphingobium sp. 1748]